MASEEINNIFLINAPAGSGKTTTIKHMMKDHLIDNPKDNILCITYTNRAAEELNKDFESKNIFIGTIHSFIHLFIEIYFSKKEIIDLYFELFGEKIKERINNPKYSESNSRYISKYEGLKEEDLNYELIRSNIKLIYYNETQFSSFYYGGLSHDDLIIFAKEILLKYPKVRKRLSQKYQIIFIDEYQDSSANVLNIFYDAVINTKTKLYFLGDKMQQIYKNYDGSFKDKLDSMDKSIRLCINYRSTIEIIEILNYLYNDEEFKQVPSEEFELKSDYKPKVLFCENVDECIKKEKQSYPNALLLFLLNKKRFESIGCGNLYTTFSRMDKYSFVQKNKAVDVIIDNSIDNPDILMKLLFVFDKIEKKFCSKNLGGVYKILCENNKIFNPNVYFIKKHNDKKRLNEIFKNITEVYNDNNSSIMDILISLKESELISEEYINQIIDSEEYKNVLEVNIQEFKTIVDYIDLPNVSTQHGVKGESHDTVIFVAEDSNNAPVVHMYSFFELWSSMNLSIENIESFYFEYKVIIDEIKRYINVSPSLIDNELNSRYQDYFILKISELFKYFSKNEIFTKLCKYEYESYLENPTVGNAKKCFNENKVYGVLSAYRLFYVGCSRARRNLTVLIDKSKIESFYTQFISKLEAIGFEVNK